MKYVTNNYECVGTSQVLKVRYIGLCFLLELNSNGRACFVVKSLALVAWWLARWPAAFKIAGSIPGRGHPAMLGK